jgi:glycosyltransferase involved in cell wall biosynthesis
MSDQTPINPSSGNSTPAPKVSFLVTSYNKAKFLPPVLESVWREAQSVGGEIILVDDGSTDGSERICASFADNHPEIHYWRQENQGIYPTVNLIAGKAQGEWVRFCDSDDPLISGSTQRLIEVAGAQIAGVAFGRAIEYGPNPVPNERMEEQVVGQGASQVHEDGLMYLIREMNFCPSMAIYRRELLEKALPLPVDFVSCQDLAMLFPVVHRARLAWIDEPVCFYLKGVPNQLSANHALTIQQTIRITQRYGDLLSPRHKRAAILKAANRTRRWLRNARPDRNSISLQLRLLTIGLLARLSLIDFKQTLGKIAEYYEHDLRPILEGRAKPF